MNFLSINGQSNGQLSIADRALNYGDGLFTTAKIINGNIELLAQHIERLKIGSEKLFIEPVDFNWLENHLLEVVKEYSLAVLKIVISAGVGGRGYSRQGITQANVFVSIHAFPEQHAKQKSQGIHIGIAETLLGINPQLAGIKHLNRLEQVLVRKELDARCEDDLLVFNINQQLIESSSANVFYQRDQQWYTPTLNDSGVNGIIRQQILNKIPNIIINNEKSKDLTNITAMFICNCVFGIVPVKRFNDTELDLSAVNEFQELYRC